MKVVYRLLVVFGTDPDSVRGRRRAGAMKVLT